MASEHSGERTDGGSNGPAIDEDVLFELLADDRRRRAVTVLTEVEEDIHLDELARRILAREEGYDPRDVPAEMVRPVALRLHHVHLPKLRDASMVEYDQDDHIARPSSEVRRLSAFLDRSFDG